MGEYEAGLILWYHAEDGGDDAAFERRREEAKDPCARAVESAKPRHAPPLALPLPPSFMSIRGDASCPDACRVQRSHLRSVFRAQRGWA